MQIGDAISADGGLKLFVGIDIYPGDQILRDIAGEGGLTDDLTWLCCRGSKRGCLAEVRE
jgi:hypothetical protein